MNIIARTRPPAAPVSNDPGRFQGDGVVFRAKLIGIMDVPELKGDKMCFDAMQKLKSDVITRGEHKPRIFVGVGFEGIKIRKNENERMEDMWHHHEVKCISFIWRDPTDARAFGYVTALSADTKKQFVAIKTERAADQVITSLKELFQVIIEMKQKDNNGSQTQKSAAASEDAGEETIVAATAAAAVASAPPTASAQSQPVQPAEEENNLFDLGSEEPPKKEENFFDMLLAPPSAEPAQQNAAPSNLDILSGALSGAAPAAAAPSWGAAPAAAAPWGAAPAAAPFNQQFAQRSAPMAFAGGAANPFFMASPAPFAQPPMAAPYAQPPMAAPTYPGLNIGPSFNSAPPAAAFNSPYGAAAFMPQPQPQPQPQPRQPTMNYGPPTMTPASAWGNPQPVAAPKAANPFANERGSAASTVQQGNQPNPFATTAKKESTPFFSDLVAAGKEMYGVWPETNKQVERPKALHELISSRQPQPVQPAQPAQSPFGADLFPTSTAIPSNGNLLD